MVNTEQTIRRTRLTLDTIVNRQTAPKTARGADGVPAAEVDVDNAARSAG
jgi:hypothetical protein